MRRRKYQKQKKESFFHNSDMSEWNPSNEILSSKADMIILDLEGPKTSMVEAWKKSPQKAAARLEFGGLCLNNFEELLNGFSTIVKLDLSDANLQCLPAGWTSMTNLTSLDLSSNQLKFIPDSIGGLTNLKVLNISSNMLLSLPRGIENCSALEELNANFNKLKSLPDTLGFNLKNLKKLSVHSNKISVLPPSTSYMKSLRVLDVHLNELRHLPQDIERLTNLEVLNASKNFHHLVALPESIGALTCLMELDVSYNRISVLPDSVGALKKLQVLGLEGNPLIVPPREIVQHSVEAVKHYMGERLRKKQAKINQRRNPGWFRLLLKAEWFKRNKAKEEFVWDEYSVISVEGSASSTRGLFSSPARFLFSSPSGMGARRFSSTPRRRLELLQEDVDYLPRV